jgi:Flp pilus assembly CpaF family ATPase
VDWALVRAFRQQVADRLSKEVERREGIGEAAHRDLARALIGEALGEHTGAMLTRGQAVFDATAEHGLAEAVFDAMFGLGRLQPLVDDPDVENIEITGCDNVWLQYADGRLERGPAVADSDEDLIADLQFLAAHGGAGERPFSSAHPSLDLQLHDGSRLAAMAWTAARPTVTIRRHRHTDVDLAQLQRLGMVDGALAAFLSAAVRAGRSVVVSGLPGAGKTTLVRALANELDPLERVATIETEYELMLHRLPDRHTRIVAMQARPGSGERRPDGTEIGAVTLDRLVYDSLRHNVSRIIVGEVRGMEILPMFKAMQAGRGSLSTTHVDSARDAVERLTTCALEAGPHISEAYAYRQIAQHIDLIVQIALVDQSPTGGRKHRHVSEVIALERGEGPNGISVTDVFAPGPDGRAVPTGARPPWVHQLETAGFDTAWLDHPGGTWTSPLVTATSGAGRR